MIEYKNGDKVIIDSFEGFGGPATVIAIRSTPGSRYRVAMDDNNPPPFWAHDFEVRPPEGDMRGETLDHIRKVQSLLGGICESLRDRADVHDASKLVEPERSAFQEATPKLKATTYGSEDYRRLLADLKPALDHHYAVNSHHPEHYADGVEGMDLLDLIEMFADWKAATLRHDDGDIRRSIEVARERFGLAPQLARIFHNTADRLRW